MSRPALWRLPPWRRAPLLALRSPAAVVAVLVTSAVLACALASAPLFLSSARSAALQGQLAPQCAEAAWPQIGTTAELGAAGTADDVARLADGYAAAWADRGLDSRRALLVRSSLGAAGNYSDGLLVRDPTGGLLSQPAGALWRPDAVRHVRVVSSTDATGVWLPASYARTANAAVGDRITVSGTPVTVAGIYTDLFETEPGAYWCDYADLYLNLANADRPPPALILATDQATLEQIAATAGWLEVRAQVPVEGADLSATAARRWIDEQQGAQAATPPSGAPRVNGRLPDALIRAETIERGLRGPVLPVAVAGGLLALALVAAAGNFWADRRATEVRLLAARGVGPVALAGKAALELALPAAAGTALGWVASRLLVAGLGPADELDPSSTTAAAGTALAAFVAGLVCAATATVAGLRARGTAERPVGTAPRRAARLPWELLLLAAAGWCWALLAGREAVVVDSGIAQVDGLLVAAPLLGTAGATVLLTRLLTRSLPGLRRFAGRRSPAVFLAVNRLAAARPATATLLAAVTLPVAVLGYTATLTASSAETLEAKVGVQIGASRAVLSVAPIEPDAGTAAVGTVVDRYRGSAGGTGVQVLAVDPRTFAGTAYWQDGFADQPLDALVAALEGPGVGGRVPVVAAGLPAGAADLRLGSRPVPAQVVATARVLPGRRTVDPVVLVAADRLPSIGREAHADRSSELWTDAPRAAAVAAATEAGGRAPRVLAPDDVLTGADFLGITWTFGYLSALAVFVGVIAVGGLLLHLEARSRARVAGYVLARRLGLSRRAHLGSLVVELAGVAVAGLVLGAVLAAGAVAVVYRRLDVDLVRPPTPLLDVPWTAIGLTVLTAVVVAVLAAGYAQRAADRADPASVLREDA